jgi:hypothetical protein
VRRSQRGPRRQIFEKGRREIVREDSVIRKEFKGLSPPVRGRCVLKEGLTYVGIRSRFSLDENGSPVSRRWPIDRGQARRLVIRLQGWSAAIV